MDTQVQARPTEVARAKARRRMLLPVDGTDRSRWALQYAASAASAGAPVDVTLLFVAEPASGTQLLRFRTQEQVRRFHAMRANFLLEDAAQALKEAGIEAQVQFREGEAAFQILDVAEQLDCDEIVLPRPHSVWAGLFCPDAVREVLRRRRGVPVVTVDERGAPAAG